MDIVLTNLSQGLIWSIMGLGLFISYKILDLADLTTEASFTLGGAVTASCLIQGWNPVLASLAGIMGGMVAGWITGLLITKAKIPAILASIITMTGLYSINLRVMGQANLSLRGVTNLFQWLHAGSKLGEILLGLFLVALIIILLCQFYQTELGQALIASGDNALMADSLGIDTNRMLRLGLVLANGLIGLSGSLMTQMNGFADIQLGTGTVVIAFSAIVIAELIFNQEMSLAMRMVTLVMGAIIYRLILAIVLQLGFDSNDFRLISATVLVLFLVWPQLSANIKIRRRG